jgi:rhamnosyltransferase
MGARGYLKNYGGWETFVDNLIKYWPSTTDLFWVYELSSTKSNDILKKNHINCPQIYVNPKLGNIKMVIFAFKALFHAYNLVKKNNLDETVFYILGVRIGPVFSLLRKPLKKLRVKIVINPDGIEWKRNKWSKFVKLYFKISESTMIRNSDLTICDSQNIESYINKKYKLAKTKFISYGSEITSLSFDSSILNKSILALGTDYYLIVARFVPENNFEYIINEFSKSKTKKKLIIISNIEKNKFYNYLAKFTPFLTDQRILIFGPLYDKKLLNIVRNNSYAYIHGHSVGGTNPSLLEAMAFTKLVLAYDVKFNSEVIRKGGLLFGKSESLSDLINRIEAFNSQTINNFHNLNLINLEQNYSWQNVTSKTRNTFVELLDK